MSEAREATPASQDLLATEAQRVVEALRALPAQLATPGLAVLLVRADLWALLVQQEGMEAMAPLAPRVRLDLPGLPEPRVNAGLQGRLARPGSPSSSPR